MLGVELNQAMASLLRQLGAVRAEVTRDGVASWWKDREAALKARSKFADMGLLHGEVWQERNGAYACFAKMPDLTNPKLN